MEGNKSTRGSRGSSKPLTKTQQVLKDEILKISARMATQPKKTKQAAQPVIRPFGGVSQVEAAPVTLGNTVRSVKPRIVNTPNGVRIQGRDYVTTIGGTATTFTGFTFQAGIGLSPIGLSSSSLRSFFQTYEKYKWNKVIAHYITSSPTSLAGDVLMFYHSNHGGPKVDCTSRNFLAYSLSTDMAVLGPQWTNHSCELISGDHEWFGTDVLNTETPSEQADGELLVYTRNTTNGSAADSPGYLLIDYDVSFEHRMLNSRVQTLPAGLFQWFPTSLVGASATVANADGVFVEMTGSLTYTGAAAAQPTGVVAGDIFQVVVDMTNSTNANITPTSIGFSTVVNSRGTFQYIPFPITTGTTIYMVCSSITGANGGGTYYLFPTFASVFSGLGLVYHNQIGANVAFAFQATVACVGSVNNVYTQASIG